VSVTVPIWWDHELLAESTNCGMQNYKCNLTHITADAGKISCFAHIAGTSLKRLHSHIEVIF
jgi:hypothetical protein